MSNGLAVKHAQVRLSLEEHEALTAMAGERTVQDFVRLLVQEAIQSKAKRENTLPLADLTQEQQDVLRDIAHMIKKHPDHLYTRGILLSVEGYRMYLRKKR